MRRQMAAVSSDAPQPLKWRESSMTLVSCHEKDERQLERYTRYETVTPVARGSSKRQEGDEPPGGRAWRDGRRGVEGGQEVCLSEEILRVLETAVGVTDTDD